MEEHLIVNKHLYELSLQDRFPITHVQHLKRMKNEGFEPKVIYDIGSCVLHWTKEANKLWPDAKIILFDAYEKVEFLYSSYDYYLGVLTDKDNKIVEFYQNDYFPGGNSYYKEIGSPSADKIFNQQHMKKKVGFTLDTIVNGKKFPLPDLVKIDVQGAEVDIINGGLNTLKDCMYLIVELQNEQYNQGALLAEESINLIEKRGFKCTDPLFCNNGPDGDYGFTNINVSLTHK